MRVHAELTGGLAKDLKAVPRKVAIGSAKAVRSNLREGTELARTYAKRASGPHGSSYFKRITGEMRGPLSAEFGPHGDVVGNAVGGGWRNGPPNTDLVRTADVIGRQFADDLGDVIDRAFW